MESFHFDWLEIQNKIFYFFIHHGWTLVFGLIGVYIANRIMFQPVVHNWNANLSAKEQTKRKFDQRKHYEEVRRQQILAFELKNESNNIKLRNAKEEKRLQKIQEDAEILQAMKEGKVVKKKKLCCDDESSFNPLMDGSGQASSRFRPKSKDVCTFKGG